MQFTPNLALAPSPFRLQVAPAEAFEHPSWVEGRAQAVAALRRGQSVVVLGQAGTGKTLLLQSLEECLGIDGKHAIGFGTGMAEADVLLVDEAGSLDAAELERLCALRKPFIAAALPEINPQVLECDRSIEIVWLRPLSPENVARYLSRRLAATGRSRDLFEPDAVLALAGHSGGLFRLVIMLAGSAMFLAEQEHALVVSRRHVDEAAAMREVLQDAQPVLTVPVSPGNQKVLAPGSAPSSQVPPPTRRRSLPGALAGLAGLGLACLAATWTMSHRDDVPPQRIAERSTPRANAPLLAQPALPQAVPELAETPAPAPPPTRPSVPPPTPRPATLPIPATQSSRPSLPGPRGINTVAFRGPIMNETMGQSGQLSLTIRSETAPGPVVAHFHAYAGLIGSGELTGKLGPDGRLNLSGQLMMGRNPYDCILRGTVSGGTLTGSATFVRAGGSGSAHSTFTLTRL